MNPTRIVSIVIIVVAVIGVVAVGAGGDRVSRFGDARPAGKVVAPASLPSREASAEPAPWFAAGDDDQADDSGEDGGDWGENADAFHVSASGKAAGASPAHNPGSGANPAIPLGVDDAGPDPNAE